MRFQGLLSCLAIFLSVTARAADPEWVPFAPAADDFAQTAIDLRFLNEPVAGEHGNIIAQDGHFLRQADNQPVRFWAVNGPPGEVKDPAELRRIARLLAKRGVNLVRIHGPVFNENGEADPAKVQHIIDVVEAMKLEGIYSHLSIYFPLWFHPKPDLAWLKGYDGHKNPFAALLFNPEFQANYRTWWQALLLTPGARSGRKLIDQPALMGLEMQNEDSFFFWTFSEANIPDQQLRILEGDFGKWLTHKYGTLGAAFAKWAGGTLKRDVPSEGRVAFRPLWNIAHERTVRDQDTAQFLFETQTHFYTSTREFLRGLGFKGVVCASNWATASPEVLGPLEKLTYTAGDFIDRHGYFSCFIKGEASEWSLRDGHIYADRSALRFDNVEPGKPRLFVHPAMDPKYDRKPSMISETTWTRPNRYRGEAPLYLAAFGALQDSDAIVHFALDSAHSSVKPNFWMQPWTLMSPAMIGQFPATALIYRLGLIEPGPIVASVNLNRHDLLALQGTPLPQDAALDELRLKDIPAGQEIKPGQRIDPLVHYLGRTEVSFTDRPAAVQLHVAPGAIDHQKKIVRTGSLTLDYERGVLTINTPKAQGLSGNLHLAGTVQLADVTIQSDLDLLHVILVPLDNQPIRASSKLLLQVMSEEQNSAWKTEPAPDSKLRITSIGHNPWEIKAIRGTVRFNDPLTVTALDPNGKAAAALGSVRQLELRPDTLYYLLQRR